MLQCNNVKIRRKLIGIYMKLIMPVLMGLESVLGDELENLGYSSDLIQKNNASVSLNLSGNFEQTLEAIARCNIHLRTAERVELEIASIKISDFDSLFEAVQEVSWEDWIPENAAFIITGFNRKSQLYANSAIQSTIKKAIVLRLQKARGLREGSTIIEDPDFLSLEIHYAILDDILSLRIDTTGVGLHKRAYRLAHNSAPIKETLAAGIIYLSRFTPFSGELLYDPCCGSGTFAIESAMMAANIAPGSKRSFSAENWKMFDMTIFDRVREEAKADENLEAIQETFIAGSDVNSQTIKIAKENASRAGVQGIIHFSTKDLNELHYEDLLKQYDQDKVLFMANPPYGERMASEEEVLSINQSLGKLAFYPNSTFTNPNCRLSVITTADFELQTQHKADKRRKLYNGMMKCTLYQYFRAKYIDKKLDSGS